jgi:hypothetical protein
MYMNQFEVYSEDGVIFITQHHHGRSEDDMIQLSAEQIETFIKCVSQVAESIKEK